jgi:naphthalene 1,2-dioxygenase ferredoxin reductase component
MSSRCTLLVNGRQVKAHPGETLVDAALGGGIVIPHDCCTAQCETCRVRVYAGTVDGQGTEQGDTVLACQALVAGDAVIEFDEVPAVTSRSGTVTALAALSPEIVEVVVTLTRPLTYLPGQYVKLWFAGAPARDYSPTLRVDGRAELNELVFHIRRCPDGVVSSHLGTRIGVGHGVRVRGPFGHAFFRKSEGRLVLVATGTGWAPIWAIARAARYHQPAREMIVVVGARDAANLYMQPSLDWLAQTGVGQITMTASRTGAGGQVAAGRPTAHLPPLAPTDTVFVAGREDMVAAVQDLAEAAGAICYADPFLPAEQRRSVRAIVSQWARPGAMMASLAAAMRGGEARP